LFVPALDNNTVEVLDTTGGAHVTSLRGFAEPQGMAIVPDERTVAVSFLAVANRNILCSTETTG